MSETTKLGSVMFPDMPRSRNSDDMGLPPKMGSSEHIPAIEAIPEWALVKAMQCVTTQKSFGHSVSVNAIARALVATDAAATAKERERAALIIDNNSLGNNGLAPRREGDIHGLHYAAAIRKGDE
jgi:hypothetical protein